MPIDVIPVKLPASNAYLVRGHGGQILVDAGSAAAVPRLRRALRDLDVDPRRLNAVVLTHGHADHAGGARQLVGDGVPILVGAPDVAIVTSGQNPPLTPTNATARMIRPFVDRPFPGYEPDRTITSEVGLDEFGVAASAVLVGGHTPGSVAVVGEAPGSPALVGDLIRGGYLGGTFRPGRPLRHYYSEDPVRDLTVLDALLERFRPDRLYVGHGGPIDAEAASVLVGSAADRRPGSRSNGA